MIERSNGDDAYGEVKSAANSELMRTPTCLSEAPGDVPILEEATDPRQDPNFLEFNSKLWILNENAHRI